MCCVFFDIRVVPPFFNLFAIGSNQFEIVDLLTFTAVGLQMVCECKDSDYLGSADIPAE
ncbi:MAG: hypothetical protein RR280_09145 [Bacteroidaceae bacterium]